MSELNRVKVGSIWRPVGTNSTVTITKTYMSEVQYKWNDCQITGSRGLKEFMAEWELVQPEPAQQNDWSYAKADALLEAATKAIAEYNEYIQRKPSTYYGSISTVGTRIEPQVGVHDGDE